MVLRDQEDRRSWSRLVQDLVLADTVTFIIRDKFFPSSHKHDVFNPHVLSVDDQLI